MKLSLITFLSVGLLSMNVLAATHTQNTSSAPGGVSQMQTTAAKNQALSDAFLEANKLKQGVKTLSDGLQYKVINDGNGTQPTINDTVTVHYSGTLIDGTEFDSSYKRGEPMTFPLRNVIPGWVEALQLMKVGATWELYIPASLAYGEQGAPPIIGPNQMLVFKVTLLDVKKS